MDTLNTKRYPIGIQTFPKIREGKYLYIDKTEYIYNLGHSNYNYVFLSRPRRFGKSLLTSTLQCYFEGRKELFEGLAIERLEKEWTRYPVLHFDLSTAKHGNKEDLIEEIELKLIQYEAIYGRGEGENKINQRLQGLIERAYQKTGQKVVVLFDEYDAPLLDVAHEEENLPRLRDVMRNFYSPLKACDPYLRFVFFTGITKFSQLSIFSELNNITNISMDEPYAGICGITQEELLTQMSADTSALARALNLSDEEAILRLTRQYDGYHFTWPSPDVFNPYSLLTAMSKGKLGAYWFESGTPTFVVNLLKRYNVAPSSIGREELLEDSFNIPIERALSYRPLLYQSGYLTIKSYDEFSKLYLLDIPNQEVRIGLMKSLLPNYIGEDYDLAGTTIAKMGVALCRDNDMDATLTLLRTFLATVPYCDNTDYEGHYQQMLYIIFTLLGAYVDVEVHTTKGRIDLALRTADNLYIMELKLDGKPIEAVEQIEQRKYADRFALCGLPVVRVGVNFSSKEKNIESWVIE